MKRIIKNPNSEILQKQLRYIKKFKSELLKILIQEQKNFCAYTEEYFGVNDEIDVEHFNPNLKNKPEDGYQNWFAVKHKPNNRKRTKWFEPILHPTNEDFEKRLIYFEGNFIAAEQDIETQNLIKLLDLNNPVFVDYRKRYIKRRKEMIVEKNIPAETYFSQLIENEIETIKYLRCIQEEFENDIWSMI